MQFRIGLLFLVLTSCRTIPKNDSEPKAEFGPNGTPINWGSLQPMAQSPLAAESKLANAAAKRLNDAAVLKDLILGLPADMKIIDGIVSVPVKLLSHDQDGRNHPFGDGQKNGSVGWLGWSDQNIEPPVTMTLAEAKTGSLDHRFLIIEPHLKMIESNLGSTGNTISGELSDEQGATFKFELVRDISRNVFRAIVVLGSSLDGLAAKESYPSKFFQGPAWLSPLGDKWAWPRVKVRFFTEAKPDMKEFWTVLFRFPAQSVQEAQATLPTSAAVFSNSGRPILQPPFSTPSGLTASSSLKSWFDTLPAGNKLADFFPASAGSGVHNQFADESGSVKKTASGGIDTYIMKEKVGKNQILYTCFDARNRQLESQWGVPSGAGWHSIGHDLSGQSQDNWTFAESIVNSFEKSGIFAGWGVRKPYPFSGNVPYGADDVVTFRVLRPDEVFSTAKHHFHWYAVDSSQKICTVIVKHLGCALKSDRELKCLNQ
jgi:hypothetical protein